MAARRGSLEFLPRFHPRVPDRGAVEESPPLTGGFLLAALLAAQHGEHHGNPPNGSGTSWLPASASMEGIYGEAGGWSLMFHGFLNLVYQDESGVRGESGTFSTNTAMFNGERGYPLLLQTGESADACSIGS